MLQLLVWNQMSWWNGLRGYRYEKRNSAHWTSYTLPFNFVCTFVLYAGTTNQQCRLNDPVHIFGLAIITNSCIIQSCCFQMLASVPVKLSMNVLVAQQKSFLANPGCLLPLVSFPQALADSCSFIMFLCSEWYLQCCTWSLKASGVAKNDKFNPFTFKISRLTLFPTCINSFLQWKVFVVKYQLLDRFLILITCLLSWLIWIFFGHFWKWKGYMYMYAKKHFEMTKIIYHIFMQKCFEICKDLFHYVK